MVGAVPEARSPQRPARANRCCLSASTLVDAKSTMPDKIRKTANLARLAPFDPEDKQLLQVIIETPRGSRNKFAYDPKQQVFAVKAVLPAGMAFPYEFGFVPSTKADDGDPVDVLVLMDEPAFPGCTLMCRPIGVKIG